MGLEAEPAPTFPLAQASWRASQAIFSGLLHMLAFLHLLLACLSETHSECTLAGAAPAHYCRGRGGGAQ